MNKNPRPYQSDCFSAIRDSFKRGLKRVIIVLATGLGKTVIFVLVAGMVRAKGGRVLILVNRDVLCDQAAKELVENGMHPVIERGQDKASPMADLVVGSIQSMNGKRLAKWNRDHFKLVICDECHGSSAGTFKAVLDHFETAYHIGVTATPNRHDKKGLWHGYEDIAYEMPLKERIEQDGSVTPGGIEEGWLCDLLFRELPVPITLEDRVATCKSLTEAEEAGEYGLQSHLQAIYEASAPEHIGRKALDFFPNCLSSMEAAEAYRKMGVNARHIEGPGGPAGMSKKQIAEILEWFRDEPVATLCNAELLAVGYNQKDINMIGMIRLIKSETSYLQKLGRGTRTIADVDSAPGKQERLNRIALSKKPHCTVLDLCIQNKDHNLCNPAMLVTADKDEQAFIRQQRKAGKLIDFAEVEDLLKAKRKTDRDEALAKMSEQVANAAERKKNLADQPFFQHIIKKYTHGKSPASKPQMNYLSKLGYTGPIDLSSQQAHLIINLFKAHREKLVLA